MTIAARIETTARTTMNSTRVNPRSPVGALRASRRRGAIWMSICIDSSKARLGRVQAVSTSTGSTLRWPGSSPGHRMQIPESHARIRRARYQK